MKIAAYIGNHSSDTLRTRIGWKLNRAVQRGEFQQVTHVEAIHEEHGGGVVTMASSSLRDGGVRSKRVTLARGHWRIFDMPSWDVARSISLLSETRGMEYDKRGALASAIPLPFFQEDENRWYCNEWVAYPFLRGAGIFGPAQFICIIVNLGAAEITDSFW